MLKVESPDMTELNREADKTSVELRADEAEVSEALAAHGSSEARVRPKTWYST